MTKILRRVALCLMLASPWHAMAMLPLAPTAGGLDQQGNTGDSFGESIEVNVVSLDVVVRDGTGNLVPGLTSVDFSLFVDGKPVEISNFYAAATAPPPAEPGATARSSDPENKRESLGLVVLIDNANMRPFDRNRLLKQLRAFLQSSLQPGDRVLVVTHDPGLHIRHAFHDSLDSLGATLDKIEKEPAVGLNRAIDLLQTMQQMRDLIRTEGCDSMFETAKGLARAHAESDLNEVRTTYSNLHHMIESLGGVEGHKALVYIGDGVPTQVGVDVYGYLQELCPSQSVGRLALESVNAAGPLQQVIADANANLVTLYTLEAAGLAGYASAEQSGPAVSFELSRRIAADRQDSLTSLARETGGRSAINGNDFSRDLGAISAELGASYSLGFTPVQAGDGRTHAIRIELHRPGLHASYRASYRDRTAQERLEGQVEAALIHGQADNPLAASLKVGTATPSEHGDILVPVQIRVPFAKLAFVPRDDGRHGRVDIVVGNIDARGGMAPLQHMQLPLRIPEADAKRVLASQLGYDVKLLLRPGHQRLAFLVRDELARVSSCVIQEVQVDKKGTVNLAAMAGSPATP